MIDFAAARRMMVDGQVRTSDVTDLRIIAAMLDVPRERFVPQPTGRPRPISISTCRSIAAASGEAGAPAAQADGAGQADPGRRHRATATACSMSAAPPATRPRSWRGLARSVVALEQDPDAGPACARQSAAAARATRGRDRPADRRLAARTPPMTSSSSMAPAEMRRRRCSASSRRAAGSWRWWAGRRASQAMLYRSARATSAAGRSSMPPRRCCRASRRRQRSCSRCDHSASLSIALVWRESTKGRVFA